MEKKYAFPPVIFYNLKENSKLLQEEIFGPNNSQYGLASLHYISNVNSGIIHINSYGEDENNSY